MAKLDKVADAFGVNANGSLKQLTSAFIATGTPATGNVPVYQSDGSVAWGAGAGSPAGANTQIQFNNSGAFGASANLTWNNTSNILQTNILKNVSGTTLSLRSSGAEVRVVDDSSNYLSITGGATATDSVIIVGASGTQANVPLAIQPKGNSDLLLAGGSGQTGLRIFQITSSDGAMQIVSSATNANFNFLPKGTGNIVFGNLTGGYNGFSVSGGRTSSLELAAVANAFASVDFCITPKGQGRFFPLGPTLNASGSFQPKIMVAQSAGSTTLSEGTAGQVLTSNGTAGAPYWGGASGFTFTVNSGSALSTVNLINSTGTDGYINWATGPNNTLQGTPSLYSNITAATGNFSYLNVTGSGVSSVSLANRVLTINIPGQTNTSIPVISFTASATSSANQTFSNVNLTSYSSADYLTVTVNGAVLARSEYSLATNTLTISSFLPASAIVQILPAGGGSSIEPCTIVRFSGSTSGGSFNLTLVNVLNTLGLTVGTSSLTGFNASTYYQMSLFAQSNNTGSTTDYQGYIEIFTGTVASSTVAFGGGVIANVTRATSIIPASDYIAGSGTGVWSGGNPTMNFIGYFAPSGGAYQYFGHAIIKRLN